MNLEQDLREALKRKEPPPGFDTSVLKRIANGETASTPDAPDRWRHLTLPVAASLILLLGAGIYFDHRSDLRSQHSAREFAQAQAAAHNVAVALLIASEKVSAAQARVLEITHHESPTKN